VHLLGTEVRAFADPLEERQNTLPLGSEPLTPIVEAGAQTRGGGQGHDRQTGGVLRNNTRY
jgi:hypothetical protein